MKLCNVFFSNLKLTLHTNHLSRSYEKQFDRQILERVNLLKSKRYRVCDSCYYRPFDPHPCIVDQQMRHAVGSWCMSRSVYDGKFYVITNRNGVGTGGGVSGKRIISRKRR
mmetsp:Transcript_39040/g.39466  ORF Transcript_39040/g.39466 Transcript_39040/m.39466 type:complete len:111 (+) Transcript_39040:125-457(+)